MGWIEHDHTDAALLAASIGKTLEDACRAAIAQRGRAFLALAGGRTPLPAYALLANAALDGVIEAVPTDDRCVPHDHPACNFRNLRLALTPPSPARGGGSDSPSHIHVHPITREDGDVDASLRQAAHLLAMNPRPFDFVLLGMGADGHIASLFPGAGNLGQGLAMDSGLAAIASLPDPLPPEAPFARISLTLPRLLHAHAVHLMATGPEKREVLQRVRQNPQSSLPVAALLRAGAPVHVHWSP